MKKTIITISAFLFCNLLLAQTAGQKKILFDAAHAETSGNGDWCIDSDIQNLHWGNGYVNTSGTESNPQQYPTATQTAVTTATAETYWEGALSYWAIDCVNQGYWVETLPYNGYLTYGTGNTQDLSKYDVLIIDEPNTLLSTAEKTAVMNFVKNGGGLFIISDHTNSDRNGDGHDSPNILNDLITNNTVQNNAFGFVFQLQNFSDASYTSNVASSTSDSITHGPFGVVTEVKWSNGTCMTITPANNPSAKGHTWKNGKGQTDTAVTCVTAHYGCGKVAAIGDSSPPDDGTGNPAASLYTGYTGDASGHHRPWLMNIVIWLAGPTTCTTAGINNSVTEGNELSLYPNPAHDKVIINFTNTSDNNAVLSLLNLNGQVVNATQTHQKNNDKDVFVIDTTPLAAGVYYCKVQVNDKTSVKKLVVVK
ncbi:MAG TPA: T9SS type A sorting domain-containing protein [Bacteroidia bacterium]|nr:T9SS type A sorting domain-containing protein [Bacteroidia bacterium]